MLGALQQPGKPLVQVLHVAGRSVPAQPQLARARHVRPGIFLKRIRKELEPVGGSHRK